MIAATSPRRLIFRPTPTPVDEVEALTGLDFFPTITNATLEATSDYSAWTNTVSSTPGFMVILSQVELFDRGSPR